ncbi:MAG: oxalate:formate antiporter [Rubrobacter sp.]|nr:oxalate:formate antiporter [Rubrobacter sp.]
MTAEDQAEQNPGGEAQSSTSWVLVIAFWAYVTIPLAWGVYETLGGVTALFTG